MKAFLSNYCGQLESERERQNSMKTEHTLDGGKSELNYTNEFISNLTFESGIVLNIWSCT